MSDCCGGQCCCNEQKDFWGWWKTKTQTFTIDEVKDLVERIKVFNAGAIDPYLTKHVDRTLEEWAKSLNK